MISLVSLTWSYESISNYNNSSLYKSFIKNNSNHKFINIHFNRNIYLDLESNFQNRFNYQYEYILYKIYLFKNYLNNIDSDFLIIADTSDVACLCDIDSLLDIDLDNNVLFGSEIHQYPPPTDWNKYPDINHNIKNYLNSGLYYGKKQDIEHLLEIALDVLSLNYKNFGGDQGVYTYVYINNSIITLDHNCNIFLNTYLRSINDFIYNNNKLKFKNSDISPKFVHDNGWNYGSPKFIEKFNLIAQ